jgi:hypothetical protein
MYCHKMTSCYSLSEFAIKIARFGRKRFGMDTSLTRDQLYV